MQQNDQFLGARHAITGKDVTPPREEAAGSLSKDPPFVSTFHVCSVIPRVTFGVQRGVARRQRSSRGNSSTFFFFNRTVLESPSCKDPSCRLDPLEYPRPSHPRVSAIGRTRLDD